MNRLTNYEKERLRDALIQARDNPQEGMNFNDIANFHGAPKLDICSHMTYGHCCPHNSDDFFTWHRLYMVQLEEILEPYLHDTDLGLPYWDWTLDDNGLLDRGMAKLPDLWEGIDIDIKHYNHSDYEQYYWSAYRAQSHKDRVLNSQIFYICQTN